MGRHLLLFLLSVTLFSCQHQERIDLVETPEKAIQTEIVITDSSLNSEAEKAMDSALASLPLIACGSDHNIPMMFSFNEKEVVLGKCHLSNNWKNLDITIEPPAGIQVKSAAVWIGPSVDSCQRNPTADCQPKTKANGIVETRSYPFYSTIISKGNRALIEIPIEEVHEFGFLSVWAYYITYDREGTVIFQQEVFAKGTALPSGALIFTYECQPCPGMTCEPWKDGEPGCEF